MIVLGFGCKGVARDGGAKYDGDYAFHSMPGPVVPCGPIAADMLGASLDADDGKTDLAKEGTARGRTIGEVNLNRRRSRNV